MEPSRRAAADARRVVRRPLPLSPGNRGRGEHALVAAVVPRRVHHPLDAVGVGARRQLARGRQDEARALAHRVDAAAHLGLDLGLRRALEDRHVHVADGDGLASGLAAARAMVEGVAALSAEPAGDLPAPLRIGIGIHAGLAVVGRMGWGDSFYLTAAATRYTLQRGWSSPPRITASVETS